MLILLADLALLAAMPLGLSAQAPASRVAPGDVVRFHLVNQEGRISGRVALVTPDTLWLDPRPNRIRSGFARAEVRDLQRSVGGPSRAAGTGVLVGFGFGAGLGVVWGSLVCRELEDCNARVPLALGALVGGIGALAGGIIGAVGSSPNWSIGVWPAQAGSGTAIGVRLTFRL